MSRRRQSAAWQPTEPLDFLIDRSLGRTVPAQLGLLGWRIHCVADEFPDDAQDVADEKWITYGLERNWVPLCKDGRIKGRSREHNPLVDYEAVLFYLDNQQLRITEMVARFEVNIDNIMSAVRRGGPAIYAVAATGIRRTWPL